METPVGTCEGELTERQRAVCDFVVEGHSWSEAYSLVFGKDKNNATQGINLRKMASCREYVLQRFKERCDPINQERIDNELAKIAFANVKNACSWHEVELSDGRTAMVLSLKDSDNMPMDVAATISEIEQKDKGGVKVKFHDKMRAIELLSRRFEAFRKALEVDAACKNLNADITRMSESEVNYGLLEIFKNADPRTIQALGAVVRGDPLGSAEAGSVDEDENLGEP